MAVEEKAAQPLAVQVGTEPMIQVIDLVKRYSKRPVNAVDGVSFSVERGEVFGLLGPNGAGKTTTIGILTTRVRLTAGRARIAGVDVSRHPVAAKRQFAVVPQHTNLDRELSARQNLVFHAAYFGMSREARDRRADELLEAFGLGDRGGDKVDRYSGGMARRLMIARALMHAPDVLFLDEPTTGIDPQARLFVWDRIKELHAAGMTVLLTTHDMNEAETLCNRIAIMDHGKILALDTTEGLTRLVPGASALELRLAFPGLAADAHDSTLARLIAALETLPGVERVERVTMAPAAPPVSASAGAWGAMSGSPAAPLPAEPRTSGATTSTLRLYAEQAGPLIGVAARLIGEHGAELEDLHVSRASLEDVFIHLTGRGLR